jgi:hypothetical protein
VTWSSSLTVCSRIGGVRMDSGSCSPTSMTSSRTCRGTWSWARVRTGRCVPDLGAVNELGRRGVEVEALPTDEAVRRYGALDPRGTAAALHLTC